MAQTVRAMQAMQLLASGGVTIEARNNWERGGRSIYFRDPDGHLLELATPGLWSVY
jgi:catechol 2,3-dioxygenase-like lactoylglutathione lyase family enzyme